MRERKNGFDFLTEELVRLKDSRVQSPNRLSSSYLSKGNLSQSRIENHEVSKAHQDEKPKAKKGNDAKSSKDKLSKEGESKGKELSDKERLELANKAISKEFQIEQDELVVFAEENKLDKTSQSTLIKLIQFKMIAKLLEDHVKLKDLAWISLYREFKKFSSIDENHNGCRTLKMTDYNKFLDHLEEVLSHFEQIDTHIKRDIKRLDNFENEKNMADNQYYFLRYVLTVQKCISFPDLLRICKINTCLGFSDEVVVQNYSPDHEMRGVLEDFKMRNKKEHVAEFKKRAQTTPQTKENVSSDQFCWLFHDIFIPEDTITFSRKENDVDVSIVRDNSQQFLQKCIEDYLFDYLGLDKSLYTDLKKAELSFDFFWYAIFYMVESHKMSYHYKKLNAVSAEDTKDTLRKTLEEYKMKLAQATDLQVQFALKHTIDFLQQQVDSLEQPEEKAAKKLKEMHVVVRKSLREIFMFYCKQQKVAKRDRTFDNYLEDHHNMSVGEWLRFCRDFELNPQHWDKKGLDEKDKDKVDRLSKEVNNTTLSNLYKLEAMGSMGISFSSFEKILRKLCCQLSEVYGMEEEKILDIYAKIGVFDGSYKNRMRMMNKPFSNGLHYPTFSPYMKEESTLPQIKLPNFNVNQEVFTRLYHRGVADKQSRQAIQHLNSQPQDHLVRINQTTGGVELASEDYLSRFRGGYPSYTKSPHSSKHPKQLVHNQELTAPHGSRARFSTNNSMLQQPTKSYVIRERARHLQNNNKKFTWETLEKMNINELKGITQINFDPATLIGAEDDEDKLYMQEYAKFASPSRNVEKDLKQRRDFEHYGEIRVNSNQSGLGSAQPGNRSRVASGSPQQKLRDSNNYRSQQNLRKPAVYSSLQTQKRGENIGGQMNDRYRQNLNMIRGSQNGRPPLPQRY